MYIYVYLDFFLYKTFDYDANEDDKKVGGCDPAGDYGQYSAGIRPSLDACYQSCKAGKLFYYEFECKVSIGAKGCPCTCYTKSDADGGCKTITKRNTAVYRIKKPGKLALDMQ